MRKEFNFYEDPGHGWLEVDFQELEELHIIQKISGYSYINPKNAKAYLEEDCDASLFIETLETWGVNVKEIKFNTIYCDFDGEGAIRNLQRYSPRFVFTYLETKRYIWA